MRRCVLLLALALLGACADYAYLPLTNATVVDGALAARFGIPAAAPRGTFSLASYGVSGGALHLRAILVNDDDAVRWTFDTREQLVRTAGQTAHVSGFATEDGSTTPVIAVPPHVRRVVDLYFPLPPSVQQERRLPDFEVAWSVHTPNGTIAQSTPFSRRTLPDTAEQTTTAPHASGELLESGDTYRFPW